MSSEEMSPLFAICAYLNRNRWNTVQKLFTKNFRQKMQA